MINNTTDSVSAHQFSNQECPQSYNVHLLMTLTNPKVTSRLVWESHEELRVWWREINSLLHILTLNQLYEYGTRSDNVPIKHL